MHDEAETIRGKRPFSRSGWSLIHTASLSRQSFSVAYKIQTRKAGDAHFADASEWLTCSECIGQMRAMSPIIGEIQIVDEQRHIIATTLGKESLATGDAKTPRGGERALADSMVER
jgi:hypothetical protein